MRPLGVSFTLLTRLRQLEEAGIIKETCPEPRFWRFWVLKPEELPEDLKPALIGGDELRYYWY